MHFVELATYLNDLQKTSSRLSITSILSDLFKKSTPDEIDSISYLLLGGIAPSYKGVVFSLAEKHFLEIISAAYEKDVFIVNKSYKETGDLGDVSYLYASKAKRNNRDLSVKEVIERLNVIASESGEGSQDKKIKLTSELLRELDPTSAKFVTRIILGKLRLGFSDLTMIDALSWMETGDKSKRSLIEKAYRVLPDIGLLAKRIKIHGIEKATKKITPVVGIPVSPMLAQRIKSTTEMIEKMGKVAIEPKFDGVRVLIHFKRGKPQILNTYTRNLNDVSYMFPELAHIGDHVEANELILDSEAVGMDELQMSLVDFQTTMQRRRKHNISEMASKIPLRFQVFDILYKDGESLMEVSYERRREILKNTIKNGSLLHVDESTVTADPEMIAKKYDEYINKGLEGIIVKKVDSSYVPGRTGFRWVKMKESETSRGKLTDTLDCIIMGYTTGKGKRTSFGLGQFLVGVKDGEEIKTITKVGTGLSDEQFIELKKRLAKIVAKEKPKEYIVHKDLTPDYWVNPDVVVELAGDDLTKSPKHSANYALRFPRLIKFRDDKSYRDATTVTEVKKLFHLQKGK